LTGSEGKLNYATLVMNSGKPVEIRLSQTLKSSLDQNAIFLIHANLPRDVRCYVCKTATHEISLYLNYNLTGEALILCGKCHENYQNPPKKVARSE
jgi:hypothetical protein